MLRELHISGLGVIEDVTVELAPGLNVLTGETGAGKTMVTVGLALALGRRAQSGLVRASSGKAGVEALFDASSVPAAGDWAEDGQLVLARSISSDGRSTARAGGQLAPVSTLAELGVQLVEIHGQHQTQRLLTSAAQLAFLDRFVGAGHLRTVGAYRSAYAGLRALRSRLERLASEEREREPEKDLLAYQVGEIEAADLAEGLRAYAETVELDPARLDHVRDRLAAIRSLERKYGEGEEGVLGYVDDARRRLEALEGAGEERDRLAAEADSLQQEARRLAAAVSEGRQRVAPRLGAAMEAGPHRLGVEG